MVTTPRKINQIPRPQLAIGTRLDWDLLRSKLTWLEDSIKQHILDETSAVFKRLYKDGQCDKQTYKDACSPFNPAWMETFRFIHDADRVEVAGHSPHGIPIGRVVSDGYLNACAYTGNHVKYYINLAFRNTKNQNVLITQHALCPEDIAVDCRYR